METKIKKRLWWIFLIFLFLPLAEYKLRWIKSGPLAGIFTNAPDTTFTKRGWWNGVYQGAREQYINDHIGFREDLVRLNSQVDFSGFDVCHAGWVVLGKNYQLFQWPYINAYYGLDFTGYPAILERSVKLKAIQDTLARLGKSLVLVYAASKASSYPEDFPQNLVRPKRDSTNHDVYRHICDSLGVNQVDMDEWFVSIKHSSKEPLFSKQGVHWTRYGALLASDSLMSYIECLRRLKLRHPDWTHVEHTDAIRDGDNDLSIQLNLIFRYPKETLAYPIVKDLPPDTMRKNPNGIFLGDSYCQKMLFSGIIARMTGQCEFWSYFDSAHEIKSNHWARMTDYDWKSALARTDFLVLEYTTFNLGNLGNGFIEQAYDYYYPSH